MTLKIAKLAEITPSATSTENNSMAKLGNDFYILQQGTTTKVYKVTGTGFTAAYTLVYSKVDGGNLINYAIIKNIDDVLYIFFAHRSGTNVVFYHAHSANGTNWTDDCNYTEAGDFNLGDIFQIGSTRYVIYSMVGAMTVSIRKFDNSATYTCARTGNSTKGNMYNDTTYNFAFSNNGATYEEAFDGSTFTETTLATASYCLLGNMSIGVFYHHINGLKILCNGRYLLLWNKRSSVWQEIDAAITFGGFDPDLFAYASDFIYNTWDTPEFITFFGAVYKLYSGGAVAYITDSESFARICGCNRYMWTRDGDLFSYLPVAINAHNVENNRLSASFINITETWIQGSLCEMYNDNDILIFEGLIADYKDEKEVSVTAIFASDLDYSAKSSFTALTTSEQMIQILREHCCYLYPNDISATPSVDYTYDTTAKIKSQFQSLQQIEQYAFSIEKDGGVNFNDGTTASGQSFTLGDGYFLTCTVNTNYRTINKVVVIGYNGTKAIRQDSTLINGETVTVYRSGIKDSIVLGKIADGILAKNRVLVTTVNARIKYNLIEGETVDLVASDVSLKINGTFYILSSNYNFDAGFAVIKAVNYVFYTESPFEQAAEASAVNASSQVSTDLTAHAALTTTAHGGVLSSAAIDTDPTLAADSDERLATQKAIKAYVDNFDDTKSSTIQLDSDDSGVILKNVAGHLEIKHHDDASYEAVVANTFESKVATGTAPFTVASTTKVDNLHVARATLADTATIGSTITVANEAADTSCSVLFTADATGNLAAKSNALLAFNAATGALTVGSITSADAKHTSYFGAAALGSDSVTVDETEVEYAFYSHRDVFSSMAGMFVASNGSVGFVFGSGTNVQIYEGSPANQIARFNTDEFSVALGKYIRFNTGESEPYAYAPSAGKLTFHSSSTMAFEASAFTFDKQIETTVATGTAPFKVASTTKVDNLHVARATLADTATAAASQVITDNAIITADAADIADNDYAKFTPNGVEGRSYAEVLSDIGASPVAGSSSIVTVGTISTGVWSGTEIAVGKGGTGLTAIAVGSILAANAENVLTAITSASGTYYLKNADGVISWSAVSGYLVNIVEDTSPQLGGTLDSNGHPIEMKTTDKVQFYDSKTAIGATASGKLLISGNTISFQNTTDADTQVALLGGGATKYGQLDIFYGTDSTAATKVYLYHDGSNGYVKSATGNLNLIPTAGSAAIIDSHWSFDGATLTALTDANTTINAYTGKNITIESVTFDGGAVSGVTELDINNNCAIKWRNAANDAWLDALMINNSNETILGNSTGMTAVQAAAASVIYFYNAAAVRSNIPFWINNNLPHSWLNAAGTSWLECLKLDASDILNLGKDATAVNIKSQSYIDLTPAAGSAIYVKHKMNWQEDSWFNNNIALQWMNSTSTTLLECLKLDASDILRIGSTSNNDVHIGCASDKTLVLDESVYDDIIVPLHQTKPGGTAPSWAAFCGDAHNSAYQFSIGDFVEFTVEIPHDWKEGTAITPHVHFALSADQPADEKVQWQLYYTMGDADEQMAAEANTTGETTCLDAWTQRRHIRTDLTAITMTNYKIGAILNCQLYRIAKSAGGTELSNEPFVLNMGFHYEIDTMGSRTISTK